MTQTVTTKPKTTKPAEITTVRPNYPHPAIDAFLAKADELLKSL